MRIAYFDCFAGASGDMILGALLDAGLDLASLKGELEKLHLGHFDLDAAKVTKKGMGGSQAIIHIDEHHHGHHHRHLSDIVKIIEESRLKDSVKEKSRAIFTRLAQAEAKVHRTTMESIHFHEVGAMDAIIDVVGAAAGFELMGIEKIYCSALHVGSGFVTCAHGTLPVPAPATAELIQGLPVYSTGVEGELLTPTGAAILTTLASEFGGLPNMSISSIGYGAGTSEPDIPNLLRVLIGDSRELLNDYEQERVAVIETNIDDMNPQIYDHLIQKILIKGGLDVCLTPIQMKKNRPGTLLNVICPLELVGTISDIIMRETTSIGLRWRMENRIKAHREIREISTRFGPIKIKTASVNGSLINISPEYDDCRRVALEKDVSLKEVMDAVKKAAFTDL